MFSLKMRMRIKVLVFINPIAISIELVLEKMPERKEGKKKK